MVTDPFVVLSVLRLLVLKKSEKKRLFEGNTRRKKGEERVLWTSTRDIQEPVEIEQEINQDEKETFYILEEQQ